MAACTPSHSNDSRAGTYSSDPAGSGAEGEIAASATAPECLERPSVPAWIKCRSGKLKAPAARGKAKRAEARRLETGVHRPRRNSSRWREPTGYRPTHTRCLVRFHHRASGAHGRRISPRAVRSGKW
eukprot:3416137-Prymnesium_polylepis.1